MINTLKATLPLVAILTMMSCSKSDSTPQGKIMAIHASPDAPGVDLLIDNVKKNTAALTFPNNSGYVTVNQGTRNIKINVAGTNTTVINANLDVAANGNYSVFAYNRVASIGAIAVSDNLAAPAAGKAHIRFFHLSPDAPTVDVGVLNGTTFTPVFSNRSFETQTTASANQGFTPVNAGTVTLQVRVSGTTSAALTIPGVTLADGKIYTIFARGLLAGNGAQALSAQVITNN